MPDVVGSDTEKKKSKNKIFQYITTQQSKVVNINLIHIFVGYIYILI